MKVVQLATRALHVAVVVEELQETENLCRAAINQPANMGRTQKTMPLYVSEDFHVAVREPERTNRVRPREAGKSSRLHPAILAWRISSAETWLNSQRSNPRNQRRTTGIVASNTSPSTVPKAADCPSGLNALTYDW